MRFGAQIFEPYRSPEEWAGILRRKGMRAAYCPVGEDVGEGVVEEYRQAAKETDVVIAEVGAWGCSLLSEDPRERERAFAYCVKRLVLADRIGARCMVSVAGSCGNRWDGPHPGNLAPETFESLVRTVQKLLDEVQPRHTFYTLELMPWMYPNSAESCRALLKAVDRRRFAVHYDPANLIVSHEDYYRNGERAGEFVSLFGEKIRSCHLKDIAMEETYNAVFLERKPGEGGLDYVSLLTALARLDPDLPVMTEHLRSEEENLRAERYIREKAAESGVSI